ncbi:MAG: hypothetical protein AB1847_04270 [bacterium]
MSQAVISVEESIHEEELILAKMFEEILSEKLDIIFKQRVISSPSSFDLESPESNIFHG